MIPVDIMVVKVINKPKQQADGQWITTIMTESLCINKVKIIIDYDQKVVAKYVEGYTWEE